MSRSGISTKMGNMYGMTDREKIEIRKMMENEGAEWAMRECIKEYRQKYMPLAMQIRAFYESMVNVGFNEIQAMTLTVNEMNSK